MNKWINFIKGEINDYGILGFCFISFVGLVFSPLILVGLMIYLLGQFNEWSTHWFENESGDEV